MAGEVLAPTRELAMQIESEVVRFTEGTRIRSTAVFGGVPRYSQASDLRRGVEILIATPGRLLDFLEAGTTNLKRVTYLNLDEAPLSRGRAAGSKGGSDAGHGLRASNPQGAERGLDADVLRRWCRRSVPTGRP